MDLLIQLLTANNGKDPFSISSTVIGDRSTYYFYDVCHMKKLSKPNGRDLSIPRNHLHQLLLGIKPALFGFSCPKKIGKKREEGEGMSGEADVAEEAIDAAMQREEVVGRRVLLKRLRLKALKKLWMLLCREKNMLEGESC
ncbi:hypothetical protein RND71_039593 [Anisodus tanguticus]|uniref:Uncharacterized protein n=1 Tax=Anisodus tanguticus TaxID=243964 RepID=A0AAE1US51_9SOLA|nr:hypothetical protein RND71_039593 [Anisodus tanguticus]